MVKSERNQSQASDAQYIRNCLTDIRARIYRQALLQTVTAALFCGFALLAILFLLNRLIRLPISMPGITWMVVSVAVIVGGFFSIKHWKALSVVAQMVDEKMELKERLSTAFGLMQRTPQDAFARFQIRDAVATAATLDLGKVCAYRVPKVLYLFPIPLLLIGISFAIPFLYEMPQPLTEVQQDALDKMTQNLEGKRVKNPLLQEHIRDTVNRLKTATDMGTAQAHLGDLNREVRKQKAAQAAIAEATAASPHFGSTDAEQLASALKNLTEMPEIPPELQEELQRLFENLAERLPDGAIRHSLNQVQGTTVTPEQLQAIIETLQKAEPVANLAALEAELLANRKELALAGIETTDSDGGIANAEGTPGQNAGTREVQGTREAGSNAEPEPLAGVDERKMENATEEGNPTAALTEDETPALEINGSPLTLTADSSGDSESFSGVFTGEILGDAPQSLPFSDVVLNTRRAYAEAISNNRIPIKYQRQIKDYLEAISEKK